MSEKRRALGRGLGALIPSAPPPGSARPTDVFFKDKSGSTLTVDRDGAGQDVEQTADEAVVSRETAPRPGDRPDYADTSSPETGVSADTETAESTAGADGVSRETGATTYSGNHVSRETKGDPDSDLAPVPGARFAEVPLAQIRPNPRQPREVFDEDDLAELTHSIREIGVLQPVVVRTVRPDPTARTVAEGDGAVDDGVRYELIMGERRWRASEAAGLEAIPAIIKDTHDDDLLRDALLENLHRSQLNPLEEAAAYQQLLDDFGCTHDELATRIGRSRPQISNTLRLLKLPPLVARRVAAGVLSAGHARALLALGDGGSMERLAQRIVAEGLSVRSVEEIVTLGGDAEPRRRAPRAGTRHPQLDDLAAALSDRFDTRVNIALGKRKGKLTVEFASVDDLNRIVELLSPGDGVLRSVSEA